MPTKSLSLLCMMPDKADWFALKYFSPFPWFSEPERAFAALRRSLAHYRKKAGEGRAVSFGPFDGAPAGDAPGPSRIALRGGDAHPMRAYGVPVGAAGAGDRPGGGHRGRPQDRIPCRPESGRALHPS